MRRGRDWRIGVTKVGQGGGEVGAAAGPWAAPAGRSAAGGCGVAVEFACDPAWPEDRPWKGARRRPSLVASRFDATRSSGGDRRAYNPRSRRDSAVKANGRFAALS